MKPSILNKPELKEARRRTKELVSTIEFSIPASAMHLGDGKRYTIHTYGCQGNEADTERIKGILEEIGYAYTEDETKSDLIILNTCAIRANAENKVFGELGRLKHLKVANPNLLLAVGGCMPQEEVVVEKILKTYHQVDLVFGTHNIHKIVEYLEILSGKKTKVVEVESQQGDVVEQLPAIRTSKHKAWVNIMFGCDEFCTYCIVPYTRGKERSRDPQHILDEIDQLVQEGYQEITLLGQNVNSYGLDFQDKKYSFAMLLTDIQATSIPRVRFTTSHPKDFSMDLIDVLSKGKNLMPYIHLPVQSGSNKILKMMNRKYTKESYLTLIQSIKQAIPGVSITTDIIVGFPGETEEDFLETLDLVKHAGFEGAYTFIFSPRSGTPAAMYEDFTPVEEKKTRLQRLNVLVNEQFKSGNERFEGQEVQVLIDGFSKTNQQVLSGYTPHNKLVNVVGDASLIGKTISVHIKKAKTWSLDGELLHDKT
ncbi:MAG: tRNA (N6-isopentenyl adenosine(37)-C2)-methylthiotransferase MiaB [Candidatus Izemoplasmatales bacterium]|nr:tRNA (N6-isopentenyl adenosine(37)-C2)-methylthiotransferase MiaB [bacterium]MDZ4197637.1 tRNA (N6-isopentenyl adenosine(37)-C2)-methylthiotransferase MiaB [Candidatus Izemoplasmatales bacterium]